MIRDLEAEGALPANSKSVGAAEYSMFTVVVDLQHRLKKVEADLARANEVIAGLAARWGTSLSGAAGLAAPNR